jgi:hypothetical protein
MKKPIIISVIILLIVLLVIVGCNLQKDNNEEKVVKIGKLRCTKGLMSIIDGTLIMSISCNNATYFNKTLEIMGYERYEDCTGRTDQCYMGPIMTKIDSIRIIE